MAQATSSVPAATFTNAQRILIADDSIASPYTSTVSVSGTACDTLSGIVRTSGLHPVVDSRGGTVTSGTFNLTNQGTYPFRVNIPRNQAGSFQVRTSVSDRANNAGTAAATFRVR